MSAFTQERIRGYLEHILQAIERIERYTEDLDSTQFLRNELVQDAVLRNIEVLGEASNQIERTDPSFTETHHHVPWRLMYLMRNRVAHGYAKVDMELVWATIQKDLPAVYQNVAFLAKTIHANDGANPITQPAPALPLRPSG